jgi:hypothetical protein
MSSEENARGLEFDHLIEDLLVQGRRGSPRDEEAHNIEEDNDERLGHSLCSLSNDNGLSDWSCSIRKKLFEKALLPGPGWGQYFRDLIVKGSDEIRQERFILGLLTGNLLEFHEYGSKRVSSDTTESEAGDFLILYNELIEF